MSCARTGMRDALSAASVCVALRSPICSSELDALGAANMCAPPQSTALRRARLAPALTTVSIRCGTAVSANFAGAPAPRLFDSGSTMCVSPATPASWSNSARPMQEPSPSDTSVSARLLVDRLLGHPHHVAGPSGHRPRAPSRRSTEWASGT